MIHARELGVRREQALRLERGSDLGNDESAEAAGVGDGGQNPHRRGPEGDDAERFDDVAGRPPGEEVVGNSDPRRSDAFGSADLFDQEPERRVEVAIQLAAPDGRGQRDLAQLARHARTQTERRAENALWQRQQVPLHSPGLQDFSARTG